MKSLIVALLAVPSLVALVLLYRGIRRAASEGDFGSGAYFTLAAGAVISFPYAISTFTTDGRVVSLDSMGNPLMIYSARMLELQHICNWLLLLAPIIIIAQRALRTPALSIPTLFAIALWAATLLSSHETPGGGGITKSAWTLGALLIASLFVSSGRSASLGGGIVGASVAILSGLAPLFRYDTAISPCVGQHKCGALQVLVYGIYTDENALGLAVSLAVPLIFLGFRGRTRYALAGYATFIACLSGSRTGMTSAVLAFVALVFLRPGFEADDRPRAPWRLAIVVSTVVGAAVVCMVLPFKHESDTSYTARAMLWHIARERLHGHYVSGMGAGGWESVYRNTSLLSAEMTYSVHNQALDVLWIAGGLGLALFVMMLVAMFLPLGAQRAATSSVLLLPMLVAGVTERTWSIGVVDWMTFGFVAVLCAVGPTQEALESTSLVVPESLCELDGHRAGQPSLVTTATSGEVSLMNAPNRARNSSAASPPQKSSSA